MYTFASTSDVTNHSVSLSPVGDLHFALKSLTVTVSGSDASFLRAGFDTGNSTMKSSRPSRSTTIALSGSSRAFLRPRNSAFRVIIRTRVGDPVRPLSIRARSPAERSSISSLAIAVSAVVWGPNL